MILVQFWSQNSGRHTSIKNPPPPVPGDHITVSPPPCKILRNNLALCKPSTREVSFEWLFMSPPWDSTTFRCNICLEWKILSLTLTQFKVLHVHTCTFRVVLHKVTCDLKLLKSKYSIILSKNNFMGWEGHCIEVRIFSFNVESNFGLNLCHVSPKRNMNSLIHWNTELILQWPITMKIGKVSSHLIGLIFPATLTNISEINWINILFLNCTVLTFVPFLSPFFSDYLEEAFPDKPQLYPADNPVKKSKQKIIVETIGSAVGIHSISVPSYTY